MKITKKLVITILLIVLLLIFSLYLEVKVLDDPEKLQNWMISFGGFAIVIYFLMQLLAVIIPPVNFYNFPQIALMGLFGPLWGAILVYLLGIPAFLLNFFLSRRYGKKIINKVVSKQTSKKIYSHLGFFNVPLLIIFRIYPCLYDYVAYAAGLTKISFKSFFWITVLAGIPMVFITYAIFNYSISFTLAVIINMVVSVMFFIMILIFWRRHVSKHMLFS
jgi:uncharacterized membrane protein YdjX (TVP38/TMEM64 family)